MYTSVVVPIDVVDASIVETSVESNNVMMY